MKTKNTKRKRNIIIFISILLVLIIAGIFIGGGKKKGIEVTTEKAAKRTIVQTVTALGKIIPETEVKISPETSGEIIQLGIKEGEYVKSGQLLARIKPDIINSQLEQMKYSAEAVKSDIPAMQSSLAKAESEYKRATELFEKKYISQQEYEIAKNTFNSAKAAVNASESRYEQAKASFRQTQKTAAKTVLFAPISGTVTKLNVEQGEKVVGTEMMQGTEIMVISDLNVMNAEVEVDENDIILVKIGDKAKIQVDALTGKTFEGEVIEIGHSAIQSSVGTQNQVTNFKVKIRITNLDPKFRPGMSCNVDISTEKHENVVSVPLQSVTEKTIDEKIDENNKSDKKDEEKTKKTIPPVYVYLVQGNKVKMVQVKTGLSDNGYIEITEGLKEGDVVVSGSYLAIRKELSDGAEIKIADNNSSIKKK